MAVTTTQIRDLLNRPRGLNEQTITEYLTIRNNEVTKSARGSLYGVAAANQVSTALKDDAVKLLVCVDCLQVLIDTVPSYYPEKKQGVIDIRFRAQLTAFKQRAVEALDQIAEVGGSAFYTKSTKTRLSD